MLDDPGSIKKVDKSDMLSVCIQAPAHYKKAATLAKSISISYPEPETIIVAGMGGSAIGGELLKDWARDRVTIPIEVCREYHLPAYADKGSLVFVVSYSGETEETLSVFRDAVKRKCMIISVSSGGAVADFSKKLNLPHVLVPKGMAPRATLPYLFIPLPTILENLGLVSNVETEVAETLKTLKKVSTANSPERLSNDNLSKSLALSVKGTVPVVYGFGLYRAVAQRFKTQFNENSKNPAKWEFFPELNHNEIVGWEKAKEYAKCFSVIFIRDSDEPVEIRQRIEVTKDLMQRNIKKLFEVWSEGTCSLAKMSSIICVGDFTSIYLAVLRGVDPTPVKTITLLKDRLKESGIKEKVVRELEKLAKN